MGHEQKKLWFFDKKMQEPQPKAEVPAYGQRIFKSDYSFDGFCWFLLLHHFLSVHQSFFCSKLEEVHPFSHLAEVYLLS